MVSLLWCQAHILISKVNSQKNPWRSHCILTSDGPHLDSRDIKYCVGFFLIFIYLAAPNLSCSMYDLCFASCGMFCCSAWTLLVAHGISSWGQLVPVAVVGGLSCSVTCMILVPWLEIEPMCSELQGEFLSTEPPEKSLSGASLNGT